MVRGIRSSTLPFSPRALFLTWNPKKLAESWCKSGGTFAQNALERAFARRRSRTSLRWAPLSSPAWSAVKWTRASPSTFGWLELSAFRLLHFFRA